METERAEEIFNSKEEIGVHLNGQSVWIESVDTANHTVQVKMEGNPQDRKTVPSNLLQESK